jgi:hypothetical protein
MFTSRHEILATGCIQALPMASTLFGKVAHRVALRFFLDVASVDLALAFFAVVGAEGADLESECFVEVCDPPAVRAEFAAV